MKPYGFCLCLGPILINKMARTQNKNAGSRSPIIKHTYIILGIALLLASFVFLPQLGSFKESLATLRQTETALVIAAVMCVYATYFVAAVTLVSLSLRKISYPTTLAVQLASGFAGKLAPAGLGGFALNARYLNRQKHSSVQSGAIMAMNNLLGFAGHICILLAALVFATKQFGQASSIALPFMVRLLIPVILILVGFMLFIFRKKLKKILAGIRSVRNIYIKSPSKIAHGFIGASLVTFLFSAALYLSALSLGIYLNPLEVLVVYTAGAIGIALSPTPGGLGGAEAALTAGLVAVGLEPGHALAVALLYRFISYWLPIIPGFIFFQFCIRRKII